MRAEVPVLTGVTETAATDIESAYFCGHSRADESHDERSQDRQSTAVEKVEDDREAAQDFQPRQVKCESYADKPWQRFIIVDVICELDGVENFEDTGVNKNSTNDKIDNAPDNIASREMHCLQQTPNAQLQNPPAALDVER